MYSAFLSYEQLKDYLGMLIENGLIEYDRSNELYKTPDKGRRFLKIYNKLNEFAAPGQENNELRGE